MHTKHDIQAAGRVDPVDLDDQVGEMDRDGASEEPRRAAPHPRPLGDDRSYPPICAHGMNSVADRGYQLALTRLRRG